MHRRYKPDLVYEVCIRTIDGAWRFDHADPAVTSAIIGAMARAQHRTGVRVHAFTFMANHYHGIYSSDFPDQFANFLCHFHAAVARIANRIFERSGRVWNARASVIPILADAGIQLQRLSYVMGQGVKARIVAHPRDWPGACSTPWLLDGTPLVGCHLDQTARTLAARNGHDPGGPEAYTTEPELVMTPLPCFAGLDDATWRAQVRQLADEIATLYAVSPAPAPATHDAVGTDSGVRHARVSRGHATAQPKDVAKVRTSPRPRRLRPKLVHATSLAEEKAFAAVLREFEDRYADARRELRRQTLRAAAGRPAQYVRFPNWSFAGSAGCWPRAGRQPEIRKKLLLSDSRKWVAPDSAPTAPKIRTRLAG